MKKGFSVLILLFVFALILGAAGYALYLYSGKTGMTPTPTPYGTVVPVASPVSESTDTKTLEAELNETSLGVVESDITDLKTSAEGL